MMCQNWSRVSVCAIVIFTLICTIKSAYSKEYEEIQFVYAPEQQEFMSGRHIIIRCAVSGYPTPTVTWFFEGDQLITTDDHYTMIGSGLVINGATTEDQGVYTCRAEIQELGLLKSRQIFVTITDYEDIEFVDAPVDQQFVSGQVALIRCIASGNPSPTLTWRFHGQTISSGGRYSLLEDGLLIRDVTSEDEGVYTCRAMVESMGSMMEARISITVSDCQHNGVDDAAVHQQIVLGPDV